MRRGIVAVAVALACAAALGAASAAADRGPPNDPPAPDGDEASAYDAWADAYLVQGPFALSGFEDDRAVLFDPASVAVEGDYLRATVRGELFRRAREQGAPARSFRDQWLVDCAAGKVRVAASQAFAQANLQGRATTLDTSRQDWTAFAEDGGHRRLIGQVCSVGSLLRGDVDRAKAMPPPVDDLTDAGVAAWLGRYVDPGKDVLVWAGRGVGAYYNPSEVGKAASGRPLLWLRSELSMLLPFESTMWRSMRQQIELDCANHRYLLHKGEVFPGANLTGAKWTPDEPASWLEAIAGSTDALWLSALCRKLSGAAAAQPPPPASKDDAAVAEWVDAYINTNQAVTLGAPDFGVMFFGTDDLERQADGHVLASIRTEYFTAIAAGGESARSYVERTEFDCKGGRWRVVEAQGYRDSNLEGPTVEAPGRRWEKQTPGSRGAAILRQICSQASLIGEDADTAMPTPLKGSSPADREHWIDEHLRSQDYALTGYSDEAASFYSTKEIERTRQDHIRVWTRLELFSPSLDEEGVIRSMRSLVEIDCDEHRSRTLAKELYPGSNLTGEKSEERSQEAAWSYIDPNNLLSQLASTVCALKDAADEPGRALPASAGQQTL